MAMWSRWWWDLSNTTYENFTKINFTTSVAVLGVILWSCWNVIKHSRKTIRAPLPPGPRGLPFIGYLPFLGTHLHKTFTEIAGVYGPVFKLWLGNRLYVVVSSPSLAKQVVRDQDTIFANRDATIAAKIATYGANDVSFCPYGDLWRKLRKTFVGNMMSNSSLDASYALRKQEVRNAIRDVYNKIGESIDIGELSNSILINSVQKVVWGATLKGEMGINLAPKLRELTAELMVLLGAPNISDMFPVLSWFDVQGIEKRMKKIISCFDDIFNSAIEQHKRARNNEKIDLLQVLLELTEHEDTATSITTTQLKALFVDVIVGGNDTTTAMLEWTMAELLQHSEVMKKVQKELEEVVGMNNYVEEFHLPKLRYLEIVVKEALRLHPVLPFLVPRYANESGTIGGYTIPKGTTIMLNVWAIHRDPQLWDNPLQFRPERFLGIDDNKFDYKGNNFQYMPFGSGRRICAGLPLAERMLKFILASLLHSFDWRLPYGTKMEFSDKFGIVIKKANPLFAIPTPRLSNIELY